MKSLKKSIIFFTINVKNTIYSQMDGFKSLSPYIDQHEALTHTMQLVVAE